MDLKLMSIVLGKSLPLKNRFHGLYRQHISKGQTKSRKPVPGTMASPAHTRAQLLRPDVKWPRDLKQPITWLNDGAH